MEELDETEKKTIRVFKNISLVHEVGMVMLEVRGHVLVRLIALNRPGLFVLLEIPGEHIFYEFPGWEDMHIKR